MQVTATMGVDEDRAARKSHPRDPSNKLRESTYRLAIIAAMQSDFSDLAAHAAAIGDGRRVLRVTLSDGQSLDVGADRLRLQCRCAICRRARIDGTFAPAAKGIEIDQATPIGQYGVNLAFSDGHSRGIFPFTYLAELAVFQAVAEEPLTSTDWRNSKSLRLK